MKGCEIAERHDINVDSVFNFSTAAFVDARNKEVTLVSFSIPITSYYHDVVAYEKSGLFLQIDGTFHSGFSDRITVYVVVENPSLLLVGKPTQVAIDMLREMHGIDILVDNLTLQDWVEMMNE